MSTKLNIGLLMFAVMVQCIFCGLIFVLPPSAIAGLPSFADPSSALHAFSTPPAGFGISALSLSMTTSYACDISTAYLGCVADALQLLFNFCVMLFSFLTIAVSIAIYLVSGIIQIAVFFVASGFVVISSLPAFLSLPLGAFLFVVDFIVIADVALVVKGLVENIV